MRGDNSLGIFTTEGTEVYKLLMFNSLFLFYIRDAFLIRGEKGLIHFKRFLFSTCCNIFIC